MNRWGTGLIGAIVEAAAELRIHRTRVLLSLIGVAVAVAALTDVVALGQIVSQSQREQNERMSGRPAMLWMGAYNLETGEQPAAEDMQAAFTATMDRYDIQYTSRVVNSNFQLQLPYGLTDAGVQAVDPDYGVMHRVQLAEGSWFAEADENRLAPAVIINEYLWEQLGSPALATHPTLVLPGEQPTTAVIIGITPSNAFDTWPQLIMLASAYERITPKELLQFSQPSYEAWVPPELSDQLIPLIQRDLAGALGTDYQVDVTRNDYLTWQMDDPYAQLRLIVGAIAGLVLLLGALGLLNISLVTVKYRIREIGIRRSFGATGGRVFFSVMMESVVATIVAGVVGVMLAILAVKNEIFEGYVLQGIEEPPPFPYEAALIGLAAATFVGALAGLLPAIIATRVKVIDAIRY